MAGRRIRRSAGSHATCNRVLNGNGPTTATHYLPTASCQATFARYAALTGVWQATRQRRETSSRKEGAMGLGNWYYRGGHPNRVARILNRGGAAVYALGIAPNYLVTLEV